MTAVRGRVASDPWPAGQRMRVIEAVAELLGMLHALPAGDCPFDRTLDVLVDPDSLRPTGVIDLGRLGRADRYADLALMSRSIRGDLNPQYGAEHVDRFLAAYGADPADPRLDYYAGLDWLG